MFFSGLGSSLYSKFTGDYGFDVAIEDPSLHIINVNSTMLSQDNITEYSTNSTSLSINLTSGWNGYSSAYLCELVNTIGTPVNITLSNNFTNGAVFTYFTMPKGEYYYTGVVHNATFEVLLRNKNTGNYSAKMVIAHNIKFDGEYIYTPSNPNLTLHTLSILGDGLPVVNGSVSIMIQPNYYTYIGIGNQNSIHEFAPENANYSISLGSTDNLSGIQYESGSITIQHN